jgi:hypothetical protein
VIYFLTKQYENITPRNNNIFIKVNLLKLINMNNFENKILEYWNSIKFPLATLIILIISHNKITDCVIDPIILYLKSFDIIKTKTLIIITWITVFSLILFYTYKSVSKNFILGINSICWILVLFIYYYIVIQNQKLSENHFIEVINTLFLIPYILFCYPIVFSICKRINYPICVKKIESILFIKLNSFWENSVSPFLKKKQCNIIEKNNFYLDEINIENNELSTRLNDIKKSIIKKIINTSTNESFFISNIWFMGNR